MTQLVMTRTVIASTLKDGDKEEEQEEGTHEESQDATRSTGGTGEATASKNEEPESSGEWVVSGAFPGTRG